MNDVISKTHLLGKGVKLSEVTPNDWQHRIIVVKIIYEITQIPKNHFIVRLSHPVQFSRVKINTVKLIF